MFFIMGITEGRKDFDFSQTVICDSCGKYGRYQVFMIYTVLSLFFIPTFKWNKRYLFNFSTRKKKQKRRKNNNYTHV